jgi:hypothetical protein
MTHSFTQTVDDSRALLSDATLPTPRRAHLLWAAAKTARQFGAADAVMTEFLRLAVDIGLIDSAGRWIGADVRESRFGRQDIEHLIAWAIRGWNPFEKGPFA